MNEISVIVCTKNAEVMIEGCLKSIKENQPLEIIVVDGNSADRTVEIARKYTDKIYSDEGKGLAYARQLGAEKAKGEYVAYVDSDVILPSNTLERMLIELKEKEYALIQAQILSWKKDSYWQWAQNDYYRTRFNKEGEVQATSCTAAICKKDALLTCNFDGSLVEAEDVDLCYRWRQKGLKLGISKVFVYNQDRASARSFIQQRIWYGKGYAKFFWKYKFISWKLMGVRVLLTPATLIPLGLFICIKERSLKMLPYYFLWSISSTVGVVSELSKLIFKLTSSKAPK